MRTEGPYFGVFAALARNRAEHIEFGGFYDGLFADLYLARERSCNADVGFFVEQARRFGGPVLDLGCGAGRVAFALARAGFEVDGIDRSAPLLAALDARRIENDGGQRISVRNANLFEWVPDRSYGLILVSAVMFPSFLAAGGPPWIGRIVKALAPGGALCFDGETQPPDDTSIHMTTRTADLPEGPVDLTEAFAWPSSPPGHVLNAYAEQHRPNGTPRRALASETVLALGPAVDQQLTRAGLSIAERRRRAGSPHGPSTEQCVFVRTGAGAGTATTRRQRI